MANTLSKVERLGLHTRVQELLADGMVVASQIARVLRAENPDVKISDSAVTRYVAKVKEEIEADAYRLIKDHVDRVVPDDLAALEEMEAMTLGWAREKPADALDRIAETVEEISGEVDEWKALIIAAAEAQDNQAAVIKKIIKRAVALVHRDSRLQSKRLAAMRMAVQIIDLKLRQAGLLDSETRGQIIITDRSKEYYEQQGKPDGDGYAPFTAIKGGRDE